MKTAIRIEPENWKSFLDDFSRQYRGREVVTSLMSSHIVALRRTGVAQLNGVWFEAGCPTDSIMITLELNEHGLITHTIHSPTFISWDEMQRVLFIEVPDSSTELLQFQSPSAP